MLGALVRDTLLTRQETEAMFDDLLVSHEPARGTARFTEWLAGARQWIGCAYLPEIARHFQ
ncbi:MAG: hypothetical protein FJ034_05615 [Chloroflexi bacterium]|nr:hypothetical protein [Chloroflexota bacterium]